MVFKSTQIKTFPLAIVPAVVAATAGAVSTGVHHRLADSLHDYQGPSSRNLGFVDAARPVLEAGLGGVVHTVETAVHSDTGRRLYKGLRGALEPLVRSQEHRHARYQLEIPPGGSVEFIGPLSRDRLPFVEPTPELDIFGREDLAVSVPPPRPQRSAMPAKRQKQKQTGGRQAGQKQVQKEVRKVAQVERRLARDERKLRLEELSFNHDLSDWAIPQAMGNSSVRREMIDRDGNAVIFGSDYIDAVTTTDPATGGNNKVGGVLLNFQLNPTQDATLSLQQFSQLYQRFEFLDVVWKFETALDDFKSGMIGVLMDSDPTDIDGSGVVLIRQAGTTRQGETTPARRSFAWRWRASKEAAGIYFCTVDPDSTAGIRQTVQSHFVFHVVVPIAASSGGLYNGTIGSWRMYYKVKFMHRQINAFLGGSPQASIRYPRDASGLFAQTPVKSTYWDNFVTTAVTLSGGSPTAAGFTASFSVAPGGYIVSSHIGVYLRAATTTAQVLHRISVESGKNTLVIDSTDNNLLTAAAGSWKTDLGSQFTSTAMLALVCHETCALKVHLDFDVADVTFAVNAGPTFPNVVFSVAPVRFDGIPVFRPPTLNRERVVDRNEERLRKLENLLSKLELRDVREYHAATAAIAALTTIPESPKVEKLLSRKGPSVRDLEFRAATDAEPSCALEQDSRIAAATALLRAAAATPRVGIG